MIISEFLIAHEAGIQMAYQKNIQIFCCRLIRYCRSSMRIVSSLMPLNCRADQVLQSHQAPLELPAVLERRAGLVFLDFLKSLGFLGCRENICNIVNYPKMGKCLNWTPFYELKGEKQKHAMKVITF